MPVHNWSHVNAGVFHDFHQSWITAIRNLLNKSLLPKNYYSLAEGRVGSSEADVLTLETISDLDFTTDCPDADGGVATVTATLKSLHQQVAPTQFVEHADLEHYATRASRLGIYHKNGDRVVAYVEIISPGNKDRRESIETLNMKLLTALKAGCHLLVIDILPPGPHDPRGMHATFWEGRTETLHPVTPQQQCGMAAYHIERTETGLAPTAYVSLASLGQPLPTMPLFLTTEHYVEIPLEQTYLEAWSGVPKRWQDVIVAKELRT